MNSLEAEYSFLAPTWKLPTVATTSMYSRNFGTTYATDPLDLGPDWALWNNTMYNSRYIPSTTVRRNYPAPSYQRRVVPPTYIPSEQQNNQMSDQRISQSGPPYYQQSNEQYGNNNNDDGFDSNNDYESYNNNNNNMSNYNRSQQTMGNRGLTYATNGQHNPPQGQRRRVQIIDQNRQTPSTVNNGHISDRDSHNSTYRQSYPTPEVPKPQPKSKTNHVEENRFGYQPNNTNIHEYLYGLSAPDPGSYTNAFKHHQRRLQEEKIGRKSVMSEYKSFAQNGGFGPSFGNHEHNNYGEKLDSEKKRKTYAKSVRETNQQKIEEQKRLHSNHTAQQKTRPVPKYQRAKEYADTIERPHNLKPVSQTEFSSQIPVLITSLSNDQRRSSLDSILSNVNVSRSRRSSSVSSIRTQRRVRFHSRDFIRRRSSTIIDLSSPMIVKSLSSGTNSSLSTRYHTEKSAAKILEEQEKFNTGNEINQIEKKIITTHSMNMRLPPTANVVINQTYKPSFLTTTTTTTNNQFKKSYSNKDIRPSSRLLTSRSIPNPYRKSSTYSNQYFDLNIKSFHHHHDDEENNSSNE